MESFLKLRAEITAHTFVSFQDKKEELMQLRIEAYEKEDWATYTGLIQ